MRKVQEDKGVLELSGTYQFLIYADINLLGENINIKNENTEALLDASKEVGVEVNAKKTNCKYIFMPHHQTTG
jgi:hypothetical protein